MITTSWNLTSLIKQAFFILELTCPEIVFNFDFQHIFQFWFQWQSWCFGTWILFSHIVGIITVIIPIDELIFFRGVLSTTNQTCSSWLSALFFSFSFVPEQLPCVLKCECKAAGRFQHLPKSQPSKRGQKPRISCGRKSQHKVKNTFFLKTIYVNYPCFR